MIRVIENYELVGLGLPYPVMVLNAAEEFVDDVSQATVGIRVPNLEGLVAAVALVRCLMPLQLSGKEVRFVRRALNLTQRALADRLEIEATETISRWENDNAGVVGGYIEKLLRSIAVIELQDKAPGVTSGPQLIPALRIWPRREGVWPKMVAHLVAAENSENVGDEPVLYDLDLAA